MEECDFSPCRLGGKFRVRDPDGDVPGGVRVEASNTGWQERVLARLTEPANEAAAERALTVAPRVVDAARELLLETAGPSFTVPDLAKRAQHLVGDAVLLLLGQGRSAARGDRGGGAEQPQQLPIPSSSC